MARNLQTATGTGSIIDHGDRGRGERVLSFTGAGPAIGSPYLRYPLPQRSGHGLVRAVLDATPFAPGTRLSRSFVQPAWKDLDLAVCIPACNEADALPACLAAIGRAAGRTDLSCGLVVVINNSTDRGFAIARDWLAGNGLCGIVCEVGFAPAIADAGHARRLAFDLGAALTRDDGLLLTTDADTVVARDWIACTVIAARGGADLICGRIEVDSEELASLPESVRICGEHEARLFDRLDRLWRVVGEEPSRPFSYRAGGASLAVTAAAYRAIGGLTPVPVSEDRGLVGAIQRADRAVVHADSVRVTTSCRLSARAPGGMADALAERSRQTDPFCDQALMPARTLVLQALAWKHLRRAHRAHRTGRPLDAAQQQERDRLAARLAIPPAALMPRFTAGFGPEWERITTTVPGLTAARMRLSEARREAPIAERAAERIDALPTPRLLPHILEQVEPYGA